MNTIPSCSTEKYCRSKAYFCCTCTEVLTPVDQLKPGDMSALHQSPTVHCDLCMPWNIMLIMAKITLDKKHRRQYYNYYGQNSFKSRKWLLASITVNEVVKSICMHFTCCTTSLIANCLSIQYRIIKHKWVNSCVQLSSVWISSSVYELCLESFLCCLSLACT